MQTALMVGLSVANHDVAAAAESNRDRLSAHGWAVVPEGHDPVPTDADGVMGRRIAENTLLRWQHWLESNESAAALFVCVHLSDALLMSGQAGQMVDAARSRGDCRCGALVRRLDDYTATRYLKELLNGRFRPVNERELAGRGVNNYLGRLATWQEAAGPDFVAVTSRPSPQSEEEAVRRLFDALGVPEAEALTLPEPMPARQLDTVTAEVLRRFNRVLHENELDAPTANDLRARAVSALLSDPPSDPFAIPPAAATSQLEVFRDGILKLSEAMSPADRDYFVGHEVPDVPDVDEDRIGTRLLDLASQLGVAVDAKRALTPQEQALADARRFARRAQAARASGDTRRYLRVVERFRGTLPLLQQFASAGVGARSASQIPARVVQYWDPSPPPEEMGPWLDSWANVAVPGGEHIVADYEAGLRAVEQVAGDLGRRAYESANHPAARSDLFRYAELYLRGGWYADAEHEAVMALGEVFTWDVEHVFVIRVQRHVVVNNFIGARPGSALLKDALLTGCRNVLNQEGGSIVQLTGPAMLTGLVDPYLETPDASFVMLPTNAVFGGVMQIVHNSAEYKVHGHWRYSDLRTGDS
jgi:mannosyltransferase OCH1-like enzyme